MRRHLDGRRPQARAAAGVAAAALLGAAPARAGLFEAHHRSFELGATPQFVIAADLDGDGDQDLAVTHLGFVAGRQDSVLSVLLNDGRGGLVRGSDFATGRAPAGLAAGDIDGDGVLDLAVANWGGGTVSVFLGRGDGTFAPKRDVAAGLHPTAIALADLDGDGRLDLAAVHAGTGPRPKAEGLAAVAEGGDAATDSSSVTLHRGRGDGTFEAARAHVTGSYPVAIAAGDVDGDGRLDLVVANRGSSTVSVLHAAGDWAPSADVALGVAPVDVALADVDGDGRADILAAYVDEAISKEDGGLIVVRTGGGAFAAPDTLRLASAPHRVVAVDADGDGRADVVTMGHGFYAVHRAGAGGALAPPAVGRMETGTSFAAGDMDGDGKPDLVLGNARGRALSVVLGTGDGRFGAANEFACGDGPGHVAAADLDGDGRVDLAVALPARADVVVLRNTGGGFAAPAAHGVGLGATRLACGDLDADGKMDLVVMKLRGRASEIAILRGRGKGGFEPAVDVLAGVDPGTIALAEVTGDRRLDLIVPKSTQPQILIYPGEGKCRFGKPLRVDLAHQPGACAVGDVNGDGKPDIVAVDDRRLTVTVLLGRGDGAFSAGPGFRIRQLPGQIDIADMNGDGHVDLVLAPRNVATTGSVLAGQGDGTFGRRHDFETGQGSEMLVTGDWNGDGRADVATASAYSATVAVLVGNGDGTFAPRVEYGTGVDPSSLAVADVDGDGRPELVVTNRGSGSVSVLRNRSGDRP